MQWYQSIIITTKFFDNTKIIYFDINHEMRHGVSCEKLPDLLMINVNSYQKKLNIPFDFDGVFTDLSQNDDIVHLKNVFIDCNKYIHPFIMYDYITSLSFNDIRNIDDKNKELTNIRNEYIDLIDSYDYLDNNYTKLKDHFCKIEENKKELFKEIFYYKDNYTELNIEHTELNNEFTELNIEHTELKEKYYKLKSDDIIFKIIYILLIIIYFLNFMDII
jgi:hypothetical protein